MKAEKYMNIFNKIIAFFMSVIISIGGWFQFLKPTIPDAKSATELSEISLGFEKHPMADELYVVETSRIKNDERHTLLCLQGLVNKEKVQLFVVNNWVANKQLDYFEESGIKLVRTDGNGNPWNLSSLIEKFSDCITDSGYVLYRETEFAEGLNTACNYATVKGWLAIPAQLKELAEDCGLKLMKDISEEEYDYKFLKKFFNEYKDKFSDKGIVHIKAAAAGLRDFAIQQGMFICYTENNGKGERFLKKVLNGLGENGIVMGWCEGEKRFVEFISRLGYSICASDHSYNLSVLNSFECDYPVPEAQEKITPDPTKHYISLIISDGDNVQWLTNGINEYFRYLALDRDYPVTWGTPCICPELCPAALKAIYSDGDDRTSFITGPSGIGYALPSVFEEKSMDEYTTQTAAAMLRNGTRIVTILDDKPSAIKTAAFTRKFDYYSRFDNIDGGIIFLDPHMYGSGEGKVWFSNGKPFLTVRKTLWSTEGYDGITDEWMKEQAAEINSYVADNDSIDGYSAICVHAWSLNPENLNEFVKLLDDHIEIVSTEQLMQMITDNVQ